jgi:hypothetical protein
MSAVRLHWWLPLALFVGLIVLLLTTAQPAAQPVSAPELKLGRSTTFITEPLRQDGEPDYVAYVDQQAAKGVAAEENFWVRFDGMIPQQSMGEWYAAKLMARPGFEEILNSRQRFVASSTIAAIVEVGGNTSDVLSTPWTSEQSPQTAAWLEGNASALSIAAEAAARPKAYAPLITARDHDNLGSVLLPHVQETRGVVRAFTARAMWKLGEKRGDDAWNDVLTGHRISRHLQRSPFEIARRVGSACRVQIMAATANCLSDPTANEDQLLSRWRQLSPLLDDLDRDPGSAAERLIALDTVLEIWNGRLPLEDVGLPTKAGSGGILGLLDAEVRERKLLEMRLCGGDINTRLELCNDYFDRMEAAMALPTFSERERAITKIAEDFDLRENLTVDEVAKQITEGETPDRDAARLVLRLMASLRGQSNSTETIFRARAVLIHAAFVAELYFRSNGVDVENGSTLRAAAEDLAALAQLSNLPRIEDPFTNGDLRVMRTPKSLKIFSVGPNRKEDGRPDGNDAPTADDLSIELTRNDKPGEN